MSCVVHLKPARRAIGFTLIELMVAVAMVGVLAMIALPQYNVSVAKSRRVDAKNALLDLAAREERYYATNNAYTATASNLGYSGSFPVAISTGGPTTYTLTVSTSNSNANFTAQALRGSVQTSDACGDYQITDQGIQSNLNYTSLTPPCW